MTERRKLTPGQIEDQRRGATRLGPGVWVDRHGDLHFSVPELLEHFGEPDTPETRAAMTEVVHEAFRRWSPGTIVTEQE